MSKVNMHFVDQAIIRAGITEKAAKELHDLLVKALRMPNRDEFLKKVDDLINNRSVYKFYYGSGKIGYCVVDNYRKMPITFMTKPIVKEISKRINEQKKVTKSMREQTEFVRYMKGM